MWPGCVVAPFLLQISRTEFMIILVLLSVLQEAGSSKYARPMGKHLLGFGRHSYVLVVYGDWTTVNFGPWCIIYYIYVLYTCITYMYYVRQWVLSYLVPRLAS